MIETQNVTLCIDTINKFYPVGFGWVRVRANQRFLDVIGKTVHKGDYFLTRVCEDPIEETIYMSFETMCIVFEIIFSGNRKLYEEMN